MERFLVDAAYVALFADYRLDGGCRDADFALVLGGGDVTCPSGRLGSREVGGSNSKQRRPQDKNPAVPWSGTSPSPFSSDLRLLEERLLGGTSQQPVFVVSGEERKAIAHK